MIYVTSDHGGFKLKQTLVKQLLADGYDVENQPPTTLTPEDDYPDYVIPVMQKLQEEKDSKAIVICRNGIGVSVLANRFEGIRCALSWDEKHAASSRNDDNTNVLALPADYVSDEKAVSIAKSWLDKNFSNEVRHKRRLEKLEKWSSQLS